MCKCSVLNILKGPNTNIKDRLLFRFVMFIEGWIMLFEALVMCLSLGFVGSTALFSFIVWDQKKKCERRIKNRKENV